MGHKGIEGRGAGTATVRMGLLGLLATLALLAAPAAQAERPPLLWQVPEDGLTGQAAGQLHIPLGAAADQGTGHLFVSDSSNARVDEFTAWGEFVKAWGWGVVASGPGNHPHNERQEVSVDATGGSFQINYPDGFGHVTAPVPFDASAAAVQGALEATDAFDAGDLAVSGPGGGPWTVEFTGLVADTDVRQLEVISTGLTGATATATVATSQVGAAFEVCVPAEGDVCRAGQSGPGLGQFNGNQGIAVDPAGDVWVFDRQNHRIQKFDSTGAFLLAIGGEVDKGPNHPGNLCTAAYAEEGDACGAGTVGKGPGQFEIQTVGSFIATGPEGHLFVGDVGRIQEFSPAGAFEGEVEIPGETVEALAMDGAGNFYASYAKEEEGPGEGVHKLTPAGAEVQVFPVRSIGVLSRLAIAVDSAGHVYAVQEERGSGPGAQLSNVVEFDAAGNRLIPGKVEEADCKAKQEESEPCELFGQDGLFSGEMSTLNALATSSACGVSGDSLYVARFKSVVGSSVTSSAVDAYGSPPDPELCPPPVVPPSVAAQYAVSVDPEGAVLKARINPRFWSDTSYYVEYGTGTCSAGGCEGKQPLAPALLGEEAPSVPLATKGVLLAGLQPATTYRFRFVAQSGGGGPVYGVAPEGGQASAEEGLEGTFRTPALPVAPPDPDPCSNGALRTGASAFLPDCRAYEMVSPVDKQNGDVINLLTLLDHRAMLDQSAASGEMLTYSSYRAFGDAQSAPYTSQYLATREAQGWSSSGISPPRENGILGLGSLETEFRAFSEDLCSGWLVHDSDPVLAEGAIEGFANVYRRDNCGNGTYEALTTVSPPDHEDNPDTYFPNPQAISPDGSLVAFRVKDRLTSNAAAGKRAQCYEFSGGVPVLVSVLPDETANEVGCSIGTATEDFGFREGSVDGAVSTDGTRIYWTANEKEPAPLYLRSNPSQPESARLHGAATGTANLIGPATGAGTLVKSSTSVSAVSTSSGAFAVGQAISGEGIAAGTTVAECTPTCEAPTKLKLSKAATLTKIGTALTGAASAVVSNVVTQSGAFAVGQEISGQGIPAATTVASAGPGTLTLSAGATQTGAGVSLSATSPCTEAGKACTVTVSGQRAKFLAGAADGSVAIYSTGEQGGGEDNLYEYDANTGQSKPIAGEVNGLLGASEDATRLYFASEEALAAGAGAGQPNLYLYEAAGGGSFEFIARFSAQDADSEAISPDSSPIHLQPFLRTSRVSPDGLHAAFMSTAPLTGYDNTDAESGEPDNEVFLYDATGDQLHCVSCNPTGARPTGREIVTTQPSGQWMAAQIPPWVTQLYASRVLSADGSRLFFESNEALVLRDTNGKVDVYEWEAPGSGGCSEEDPTYSPPNGGCIALISSGKSSQDSQFIDADEDGSDVFFATGQGLVAQDPGLIDLYDARVGGGFPPPPGPPVGCEGEACQSPPEAPNDPTPASLSAQGAGNVVERPPPARSTCRKGKVRRHGKCVVKKHRKRSKHSRRGTR